MTDHIAETSKMTPIPPPHPASSHARLAHANERRMMTDRPILFSGPMVRALLAGRKTQTRRIIKPRARCSLFDGTWTDSYVLDPGNQSWLDQDVKYRVGDRLWVREAFSGPHAMEDIPQRDWRHDVPIWYWADGNPDDGDWTTPKPSIHMPRWASRITLTVTDVRVQRLQEICEDDARAEGVQQVAGFYLAHKPDGMTAGGTSSHAAFALLWNSIHGRGAWEANPWVVALRFTVGRKNVDV